MATANLNADEFRADMHTHGRAVRAWMALQSSAIDPVTKKADPTIVDGRDESNLIYEELDLAETTKVFMWDMDAHAQAAEFGQINQGAAYISFFRDEFVASAGEVIGLAPGFKILPVGEVKAPLTASYTIKRAASGNFDNLKRPFVGEVLRVFRGATTYVKNTHYRLVANADSSQPFAPDRIEWLTGTKPGAGETYSILHSYRHVYVALMQSVSFARPDVDGVLLPEQWVLNLEQI